MKVNELISDSFLWQNHLHLKKIKTINLTTQKPSKKKNVDHTTIKNRLRTGSWSNDSHVTGEGKPI